MEQNIFPESVLKCLDDAVNSYDAPDHLKSALALVHWMNNARTGTIQANISDPEVDYTNEKHPAHPYQIHSWLASHGLANSAGGYYSSNNSLQTTSLATAYIKSKYPFGAIEPVEVDTLHIPAKFAGRQLLRIGHNVKCTAQITATLDGEEVSSLRKAQAEHFEKIEAALSEKFYGLSSADIEQVNPLVFSSQFSEHLQGYRMTENKVTATVPLTSELLDGVGKHYLSSSKKTGYSIDGINVHHPGHEKPLRGGPISIASVKFTGPHYATLYLPNGLREAALNGLPWEVQQAYRTKSAPLIDTITQHLGFKVPDHV